MKQHVRLRDWAICPICSWNDIDTAVFYAIGDKMQYSTPYLVFCCSVCKFKIEVDWFDVYFPPTFVDYGGSQWTEMEPLFDFEEPIVN